VTLENDSAFEEFFVIFFPLLFPGSSAASFNAPHSGFSRAPTYFSSYDNLLSWCVLRSLEFQLCPSYEVRVSPLLALFVSLLFCMEL